eukprot:138317-Alexandrium_andersonii.AAC.1
MGGSFSCGFLRLPGAPPPPGSLAAPPREATLPTRTPQLAPPVCWRVHLGGVRGVGSPPWGSSG